MTALLLHTTLPFLRPLPHVLLYLTAPRRAVNCPLQCTVAPAAFVMGKSAPPILPLLCDMRKSYVVPDACPSRFPACPTNASRKNWKSLPCLQASRNDGIYVLVSMASSSHSFSYLSLTILLFDPK